MGIPTANILELFSTFNLYQTMEKSSDLSLLVEVQKATLSIINSFTRVFKNDRDVQYKDLMLQLSKLSRENQKLEFVDTNKEITFELPVPIRLKDYQDETKDFSALQSITDIMKKVNNTNIKLTKKVFLNGLSQKQSNSELHNELNSLFTTENSLRYAHSKINPKVKNVTKVTILSVDLFSKMTSEISNYQSMASEIYKRFNTLIAYWNRMAKDVLNSIVYRIQSGKLKSYESSDVLTSFILYYTSNVNALSYLTYLYFTQIRLNATRCMTINNMLLK